MAYDEFYGKDMGWFFDPPPQPAPKPPQPTAIAGTGSAVMRKVENGIRYIYDNQNDVWVPIKPSESTYDGGRADIATHNLAEGLRRLKVPEADTGEGTKQLNPPSPREQVEGVKALTDQMRREEMALMPPTTRTQTQPMTAPVMPPNAQALRPPVQFSDPETVARLEAQRPTPSQFRQPSEAANTFYKMQQVDWLMRNRGMKPADAMKMVGIGQAPAMKPVHVGDALVDPRTGQTIYTAPPKAITPMQQFTMERWKRQDEIKAAELEIAKKKAQNQISPAAKERIKVYEDDLSSVRKAMLNPATTPEQQTSLMNEYGLLWERIKNELPDAAKSTGAQTAVTKPSVSSDIKTRAMDAIKAGADKSAVKARYKKLTGEDLE